MTPHINMCTLQFVMYCLRKVTKGVIRSVKRRTDNIIANRETDKKTNNDLQSTTQKTKDGLMQWITPMLCVHFLSYYVLDLLLRGLKGLYLDLHTLINNIPIG